MVYDSVRKRERCGSILGGEAVWVSCCCWPFSYRRVGGVMRLFFTIPMLHRLLLFLLIWLLIRSVEGLRGFIIARLVGRRIRLSLCIGMGRERKSRGMCICTGIFGSNHRMGACGIISSRGSRRRSDVSRMCCKLRIKTMLRCMGFWGLIWGRERGRRMMSWPIQKGRRKMIPFCNLLFSRWIGIIMMVW